ncbi:MAG: phosphonopyruvate decarboxylase [Burkholderiales bacterium]|nr:phosphonopyruvate decarboxylase [Burkholderiales bacterium]
MSQASPQAMTWQDDIFRILKSGGVKQLAYVPDAGHSHVIRRAHEDADMHAVVLTTEEEGVAMACGAWLGGDRAVLLMQSSGVGNCVNMFSLIQNCRFPFLTLITMRGEWAEFNPWQAPMGLATQKSLELMGITVLRANEPQEVAPVVQAGFDAAFNAGQAVAILLSQRLIGRKEWEGSK